MVLPVATSFEKARGTPVSGSDPLPTREVLDWVKSEAWRRCSLKAIGLGWPVGEAGIAVMRLAAPLALQALTKVAPAVALWRAARCLGLSEAEAAEGWNRAVSLGPWAGEEAAAIAELVLGGELTAGMTPSVPSLAARSTSPDGED